MKTLANCKPTEFLKQTNRIRKSVEKWLTETDIVNIRKRLPHTEIASINATPEEQEEVSKRNRETAMKQMRANLSAMLDSILDEHADETLELLALCCFVEPEEVDDHPMKEYLGAFTELMNSEEVMGFFTSLVQWGQMVMRNA